MSPVMSLTQTVQLIARCCNRLLGVMEIRWSRVVLRVTLCFVLFTLTSDHLWLQSHLTMDTCAHPAPQLLKRANTMKIGFSFVATEILVHSAFSYGKNSPAQHPQPQSGSAECQLKIRRTEVVSFKKKTLNNIVMTSLFLVSVSIFHCDLGCSIVCLCLCSSMHHLNVTPELWRPYSRFTCGYILRLASMLVSGGLQGVWVHYG